jgi:toxin ParE1/3/4
MRKWRLSKEAQADMREIRLFSKQYWGEEQSQRYIKAIRAKLELLVQNSYIGMDRADDLEVGIKSIFTGSHAIYYEFDAEILTVKAILHQSMTPDLHLRGKLD